MRIAVCDDNTYELERISSLLEEYSRVRNRSVMYESFHNAIELLDVVRTRKFDLIILDILMPGITGMDAAWEIRDFDKKIPIIFLTSSREFAVESYRINAENYILKPANESEIFATLDKQFIKLDKEEPYLMLKEKDGLVKLLLSEIVYVEVMNRVVYFTLKNGAVREAYGYLSSYEDVLLSNPAFYKPHRAYIVNMDQVTELNKKGFATLVGKNVPVARDAFVKAKTAYMKHLLSHHV